MMSSGVTLLVEEEGVDVDGVEEVGGAVDPDRLDRNYTSLHLIDVASITPI